MVIDLEAISEDRSCIVGIKIIEAIIVDRYNDRYNILGIKMIDLEAIIVGISTVV